MKQKTEEEKDGQTRGAGERGGRRKGGRGGRRGVVGAGGSLRLKDDVFVSSICDQARAVAPMDEPPAAPPSPPA